MSLTHTIFLVGIFNGLIVWLVGLGIMKAIWDLKKGGE